MDRLPEALPTHEQRVTRNGILICMDARSTLLAFLFSFLISANLSAQQVIPMERHLGGRQSRSETANFVVHAANQQMADQVAQAAESYRSELSQHWLGRNLPNWSVKCPITVMAADHLGAGGETTFTLSNRSIVQWRMRVQGTYQRVLDSVLPHEITHTVLATHFAKFDTHVPRWADEGASTTVEHMDERTKNDRMLIEFLSTGRGIPFATLFSLKEYPADILPLYAQGYSLSMFLIGQGGPQKFVQFLETGVQTADWVRALETHYGYQQLGKLQTAWNRWVADGGGAVNNYTAIAMNGGTNDSGVMLASAQVNTTGSAANNALLNRIHYHRTIKCLLEDLLLGELLQQRLKSAMGSNRFNLLPRHQHSLATQSA